MRDGDRDGETEIERETERQREINWVEKYSLQINQMRELSNESAIRKER